MSKHTNRTRIYVVKPRGGEQGPKPNGQRLVLAGTPSQAIRHVVKGSFSAEVADQSALVELVGLGVKVEDASA